MLGDGLSGLNSDLPLPNGTRTDIFDERDDRPAAYALVTLGDPAERVALKVGYFDNRGDQNADGSWNTHFTTVGAVLHPLPNLDLVVQYLDGEAGARHDQRQLAASVLCAAVVSPSIASREFATTTSASTIFDGGNSTEERGDGITAAYAFEWGLRHRIGVEYTWLDSKRPGSTPSERSHDGWQPSYRFRY